jgi:hypothetical protein
MPFDDSRSLRSSGKAGRTPDGQWKAIFQRSGRFPVQYYGEIFNPLEVPPEEPGIGDLADDLADIHRDLSAGLDLYDRGDIAGAVWEWRYGMQNHWGEHATGAIRVLHCWLAANNELAT